METNDVFSQPGDQRSPLPVFPDVFSPSYRPSKIAPTCLTEYGGFLFYGSRKEKFLLTDSKGCVKLFLILKKAKAMSGKSSLEKLFTESRGQVEARQELDS
jgi:hypothetical protein